MDGKRDDIVIYLNWKQDRITGMNVREKVTDRNILKISYCIIVQ